MLKNVLLLIVAIAALNVTNQARGAIILSANLNPSSSVIQSSGNYNVGDTITAGIFMQLETPADSVAIYSFSVNYDATRLNFVSRNEFGVGTATEADFSNPAEIGILRRFDGLTFGAGPVGAFGPVEVARLTFTALAEGPATIAPGLFEVGFDEFFNNGGVSVPVVFNGATANITAVPEPSTIALLSVAGLTAIGSRRWLKLRKNAKIS